MDRMENDGMNAHTTINTVARPCPRCGNGVMSLIVSENARYPNRMIGQLECTSCGYMGPPGHSRSVEGLVVKANRMLSYAPEEMN